jgi:pimeloyl-ACP methyl ester carboxylesterase
MKINKFAIDESIDNWKGYTRHNFQIDGCPCWVVEPADPLPEKFWVWCMEFPEHFPERCAEIALLKSGFYLAYMNVGNTFGCPAAIRQLDAFYENVSAKGLNKKAVLIGISRGGLYAYNWAAKNPEKVSVIYGDAPVCDFKSWPAGQGKGLGSVDNWQALLKSYHFQNEAEALAYALNPIEKLEILAKAKIALIHVVGDLDDIVPVAENTSIVEQRYTALGGEINVIHRPGAGHHPHGLDDPTPVVDFIVQHVVADSVGTAL